MKYDAEGRIVQTGIYTNNSVTSARAMQQLCDSTATLWETWQPGTGYTDNAFPQSNTNLYTTYYYDDYSFPEAAAKPFQTNTYGTTPTGRTMGMLTGTSVYVLGSSSQYLVTVNYYDRQNRLIQQIGDNHLGYVDVVSNQYNFAGEQTGSQRVTTPLAGTPVTVQDRYVNDHLGRLLDTWESFQGGDEVDISHNVYNEVDQKVTESLHTKSGEGFGPAVSVITRTTTLSAGTNDVARDSILLKPGFHFTASDTASYSAVIGTGSAQTEAFRYNIRGWLTQINNGTLNNNGVTQTDPHALFGESITYWETSPLSGAVPQYNGNISGFTWRNRIEDTGKPGVSTGGQGYSFVYDNVDRFISNSYYTQHGTGETFDRDTNDAYTEILSGYDYMGNITSMERKDKDGNDLNSLLYYYDTPSSNVLTEIHDNGSEAISGTFSYDGNGNMTGDSHKGITIHYNYLNLPDTISKSASNSKLIITYDAAGNKLSEQLDSAGTIIRQRHYVEDVELTATTTLADAVIESVAMDEGRIVNTPSGFKYEYNLQNHLYSNQVSFRPADTTLTVSMVQNYYPFGRDMGDTTMNYSIAPLDRYRYESKEWQPGLGMDMYDFGARYYDPTLATWHSIDPLAEQSAEWSGYNYVGDNPINIIDPDGMQWSNANWSGVPIGKGTAGGTAFGAGWNIASGGASAADALVNAINAYNASTPGFSKVQDFSKFGATQTTARSSIPQARPPVQLDKSGITPDQREFIDQVTNRIVKEYNQTHGKPVHVGRYNPSTGRIQGSGAVEQLFPENGIIQAGFFLATDGLSAEAEILEGAQYTKSSLKLGQEMHKAYKAGDVIEGVAMKEFREIPGIRPDFVDFRTNTIYELKPFNPRSIRSGIKQLDNYKKIFEKKFGGTWNTVLEHY